MEQHSQREHTTAHESNTTEQRPQREHTTARESNTMEQRPQREHTTALESNTMEQGPQREHTTAPESNTMEQRPQREHTTARESNTMEQRPQREHTMTRASNIIKQFLKRENTTARESNIMEQGPQREHTTALESNTMEQDNPVFSDIGGIMNEAKEKFSIQVPEEISFLKGKSKRFKQIVGLLSFLLVAGVTTITTLSVVVGEHKNKEQVADTCTNDLEKTGHISMALTLDHQFDTDMANVGSTVYELTQSELCSQVKTALKSYQKFPKDLKTGCDLESLQNDHGSIKVALKLSILGLYTIPANSMYVQAINTYIGARQTLGSFKVKGGSIAVTASSYAPVETTDTPSTSTPVTSTPTTSTPTTSTPTSTPATSIPVTSTPTTSTPTTTTPTTSTPTSTLIPTPREQSSTAVSRFHYTDMIMNGFIGRSSDDPKISCSIHHIPLAWTELRIKSISNDEVHAIAYPNGQTAQSKSSYNVELTQSSSTIILDVTFPNTTTSCMANGSYVCILVDDREIISSKTTMVTITDGISNLRIYGNTSLNEGDRYMISCSATFPRGKGGEINLYVKTANYSEFISPEHVSDTTDDVNDVCHHSVTKTYKFLAENNQNGTEMKCITTMSSSGQSSNVITISVEPADFSTVFHLKNATWNPAYSDVNSREFRTFATGIEHDTDYVFGRTSIKNNYRRSKVVGISQMNGILVDMAIQIDLTITVTDTINNVITTKLNANDILGAFVQTLPTVATQLPHSHLTGLDTKDLVGDLVIDHNVPNDGCASKTDLIFVLDASGSIGEDNFVIMKYFIQNFTATVSIGKNALQIGVVKFDDRVYNEFWLNSYDSPLQISHAVNRISYTEGGTNLGAALGYTRQNAFTTEHGARNGAGRVIIVMTDGRSQDMPDQVAGDLKREGVVIVSIGIGGCVDLRQLNTIAYNSTFVFQVNDFGVLINIKKIVQSSTCNVEEHRPKYD